MGKGIFQGVSGVARSTATSNIGVSGVARKIIMGFIGVSGVAREFWNRAGTIITSDESDNMMHEWSDSYGGVLLRPNADNVTATYDLYGNMGGCSITLSGYADDKPMNVYEITSTGTTLFKTYPIGGTGAAKIVSGTLSDDTIGLRFIQSGSTEGSPYAVFTTLKLDDVNYIEEWKALL